MKNQTLNQAIITLAKDSTWHQALPQYNWIGSKINESCQDSIIYKLLIENNVIIGIELDTQGCMLSRAAAVFFARQIINQNTTQLSLANHQNMLDLLDITVGPNRLECIKIAAAALNSCQPISEHK